MLWGDAMLKSWLGILILVVLAPAVTAQELHPQAAVLAELRGDISAEEAERALRAMYLHIGYVAQHEVGHLVINELSLPVLGREEDAADSLSTLFMLAGDPQLTGDTLRVAVQAWIIGHNRSGPPPFQALAGEHSLDLQRAYHAICMMIGKDPETFTPVADYLDMPTSRRERCGWEYERLARSWRTVLDPHRLAAGEAPGKVQVVYTEPSPDLVPYAEILRDEGLLDILAQSLASEFRLPRELGFVGMNCGHPNAYYSPAQAQVTICYELAAASFQTFADEIVAARELAAEPRLAPDPS